MTEPEILELPAREMDALAAESLFSFAERVRARYMKNEGDFRILFKVAPERGAKVVYNRLYTDEGEKVYCGRPYIVYSCERYTTNISAAWQIVERMQELGYLLDLRIGPKESTAKFFTLDHECAMVVLSEFARSHEDPKLAVILAALDAMGVIE